MTIQFRCTQCDKLLSAPDDAVGKQAKCPNCSTVSPIPGTIGAPPGAAPTPGPTGASASAVNPFADLSGGTPFKPAPATLSSNPYATSTTITPDNTFVFHGSLEGLRPTTIDFERVISQTWTVFSRDIGPCLLLGLVLVGVYLGQQVVSQIVGMATGASGRMEIVYAGSFLNGLFSFFVQTYVQLGTAAFSLRLVRDGRASSEAFATAGSVYGRGLGVSFLIGLLAGGLMLICCLPAMIAALLQSMEGMMIGFFVGLPIGVVGFLLITLHYYLCLYFLVDRRVGVFEAMSASGAFMRGNKLVVFGLMLVVGLAGGVFVLVTCFIGSVAYYPFLALLNGVIYVLATGQQVAVRQIGQPSMS